MPMLAVSDRDASRIIEALRCLSAAKQESEVADLIEVRDLAHLAGDIERSVAIQRLPIAKRPPCRCDQDPNACVLHGSGVVR